MIRERGVEEVVSDGERLREVGGADSILATDNSNKSVSDATQGLPPWTRHLDGSISRAVANYPPAALPPCPRHGCDQNGPEYPYEALVLLRQGQGEGDRENLFPGANPPRV